MYQRGKLSQPSTPSNVKSFLRNKRTESTNLEKRKGFKVDIGKHKQDSTTSITDQILANHFYLSPPWVQNYQSLAISQRPVVEPSQTKGPTTQTLVEQVFALPMYLFLQYLPRPTLNCSGLPRSGFATSYRSAKAPSIQSMIRKWEMNSELYYTPPSAAGSASGNLYYELRGFFRELHYCIVEHRNQFSNSINYTRLGFICHTTGALQYHFQCISHLIKLLDRLVGNALYYNIQYFYFNILMMLRAMAHIESICLQGYYHQIERNPTFRYYVEKLVLCSCTSSHFTPFYSVTPNLILCFLSLPPTDPILKKFYLSDFPKSHQFTLPKFLSSKDIVSSEGKVPESRLEMISSVVAFLAPFVLVISTMSSKLAKDIHELFINTELNQFWEELFSHQQQKNHFIEKFTEWFEPIICYVVDSLLQTNISSSCYSKSIKFTIIFMRVTKLEMKLIRNTNEQERLWMQNIINSESEKIPPHRDFQSAKTYLFKE